jgi:hypothetical protein
MYGPTVVYASISSLLLTCELSSHLFSLQLQHLLGYPSNRTEKYMTHLISRNIWIHISIQYCPKTKRTLLYLFLGTAAFRTIPFGVVRWRIHQHHVLVVWAPREVAAWLLPYWSTGGRGKVGQQCSTGRQGAASEAIRTRHPLNSSSKRNIPSWSSKFHPLYQFLPHSSILYIILYPLWGPLITLSKYIHVKSSFEGFIATNLMVQSKFNFAFWFVSYNIF